MTKWGKVAVGVNQSEDDAEHGTDSGIVLCPPTGRGFMVL